MVCLIMATLVWGSLHPISPACTMSTAALPVLERALERLIKGCGRDKSRAQRFLALQEALKNNPASPIDLDAFTIDLWRALFWNTGGLVAVAGAEELNLLEKMLSHGLIGSTLQFTNEDGEVVSILKQSIDLAGSQASRPDSQLECIKVFLTASTTPNCGASSQLVLQLLKELLVIFERTKVPINKAAARGTLIQICSDRLALYRSHDEHLLLIDYLCKVRSKEANTLVLVLDIIADFLASIQQDAWASLRTRIEGPLVDFCIATSNFRERDIFQAQLRILQLYISKFMKVGLSKEVVEVLLHRLIFLHDHLMLEANAAISYDKPTPLQIAANRFLFLQFIDDLTDTQLLELFVNFDMDPVAENVIEPTIKLLTSFIKQDHLYLKSSLNFSSSPQSLNLLSARSMQTLNRLVQKILTFQSNDEVSANIDFTLAQNIKARRKRIIRVFNKKPFVGLEMARNEGLIDPSQKDKDEIAFLRFSLGLDKRSIGDYFGEPNSAELLERLLETLDFKDRPFVTAIRDFLQLFRLPGEAQKIDRIMEAFSRRYAASSQHQYLKDPDLIYQLAFTTVMLNTDLHSPQVKVRTNKEAFVKNYKNLLVGKDVPESILEDIFKDVASQEIQLSEVFVISSLPLDSRPLAKYEERVSSEHARNLLLQSSSSIADSFSIALSKYEELGSFYQQKTIEEGQTKESSLLLKDCRDLVEDLVDFSCAREVEGDFVFLISAILKAYPIKRQSEGNETLRWIYSIIASKGCQFHKLWIPFLNFLSKFEITSMVDEHHNIVDIDLSRLDGYSLLFFIQSLLGIFGADGFIKHYAEKLEALPSNALEKLLVSSYTEPKGIDEGIFSLLSKAFTSHPGLSTCSFMLISRISQEQMPFLAAANGKALAEFIPSLIQFGLCRDSTIADDSLGIFRFAADLLFAERLKAGQGKVSTIGREEFFLKWYPILSGLSHVAIYQDNVVICGNAIKVLFEVVKQQGVMYSPEQWKKIVRAVIMPAIEDLQVQLGPMAIELLCVSLNWMIDLLIEYNPVLVQNLSTEAFSIVLNLIESLIGRNTEQLSKAALLAFHQLITKNHLVCFSSAHWDMCINTISVLTKATLPTELLEVALTPRNTSSVSIPIMSDLKSLQHSNTEDFSTTSLSTNPEFAISRFKCSAHLILLQTLKEIILEAINSSHSLVISNLTCILDSVRESMRFAQDFNANLPLRQSLQTAGFLGNIDHILLSKQEAASVSLQIHILFAMFRKERFRKAPDFCDAVEDPFQTLCLSVISDYISENGAIKRNQKCWPSVIGLIYEDLSQLVGTEKITWIHEFFEPSLNIFKQDGSSASDSAHEFLKLLCKRYIA